MHKIVKTVLKENSRNFSISTSRFNKKRICIVGGGPAGFYAAQYLLKNLQDCWVDVIEKLPVPFGLVRYGVAPDHPEVKNVINTFTKTAEHTRFRFFGNLTLGEDISLRELRDDYHAVLLSYGANEDRHMNIPNEHLAHVISARHFVAWYNGLPGAQKLAPNLRGNTVTIIGQGNVAIDVARMLLTPIDILRKTDTTEYALAALAESKVQRVHLVGRRGPLQAAFTIKELREMLKLPQVRTIWRTKDFEGLSEIIPNLPRPRKRLTELMLKSMQEQTAASQGHNANAKEFVPIFYRAPKSVDRKDMEFTVTHLVNNMAVATQDVERLSADLVLRSIGYKSSCADKSICFDANNGLVHNSNGRVYSDASVKSIDHGLYVAGWLGTGPTGVILTTMNTAFCVAKAMCDDILNGNVPTNSLKSGLNSKNKRVVDWNGWRRIDAKEISDGLKMGKPREKIIDIEEMLHIAGIDECFVSSETG